jgi:hypothetical protein
VTSAQTIWNSLTSRFTGNRPSILASRGRVAARASLKYVTRRWKARLKSCCRRRWISVLTIRARRAFALEHFSLVEVLYAELTDYSVTYRFHWFRIPPSFDSEEAQLTTHSPKQSIFTYLKSNQRRTEMITGLPGYATYQIIWLSISGANLQPSRQVFCGDHSPSDGGRY